jgi:hypothetical protein
VKELNNWREEITDQQTERAKEQVDLKKKIQ